MSSFSNLIRIGSPRITNLNCLHLRAASTSTKEKIEIPKYIPRGPTDILRALESTVSKDPTAAHYKYHDDPYLIPMSNIGKRTFAMAQEAGRKAAHWVREQHPELFGHRECDPPVKLFFPKMVYNEKSEVTEQDLVNVINDVLVSDAVTVYKLLCGNGVEIAESTKQQLLELLCFYNNEDTLKEEFIEERWFRQSSRGKMRQRKTWKDGALAEEVFNSIENPTAETYSVLIQGMAKYYQVDHAWQLFEEAQQKGIVLNANTYNAIISVSNFLKEGFDVRWTFIRDLLVNMEAAKVRPNLQTLNSVMEALSMMGVGRQVKVNALKVLNEFKALGIEPSLATWYFLLMTYCKERGPVSGILNDILPHIENRAHRIRDIKDTYFFVTAMDVCRNHLHSRDLALRVNSLLHFGNNYDLIGDSYKESIYYRHYLVLLCNTETLDDFINKYYYKLVPHVYVPEPAVMEEILKNVEANAATEYLPKLWSDMTIFDHTERESLLHLVLNIMVTNEPESQSDMHEKFAYIAWSVWTKIENQSENRIQKLAFSGEMLGNILTLVLRNNDFEKATMVMDKLDKDLHSVVGVPKIEALSLFVDHCINEKAPSKGIQCIQYCADSGFTELDQLVVKLNKGLTLDETHLNKLAKIVGEHVIDRGVQSEESAAT